jgi:SOS-response transcriptional repressor LexA
MANQRKQRESEEPRPHLVDDLSPIGMPPTNENSFAVRYDGTGLADSGIKKGDTVLMEKRQPQIGGIVLAMQDEHVSLIRFTERTREDVELSLSLSG